MASVAINLATACGEIDGVPPKDLQRPVTSQCAFKGSQSAKASLPERDGITLWHFAGNIIAPGSG